MLLVTALNLALARHLPADVLALLLRRKLRIEGARCPRGV